MKLPAITKTLWPWAAAIALVSVISGMQQLDEHDTELHDAIQSAKQERRKELSSASFCIKTNGPSSRASWDAEGVLSCSRQVATVAGGV